MTQYMDDGFSDGYKIFFTNMQCRYSSKRTICLWTIQAKCLTIQPDLSVLCNALLNTFWTALDFIILSISLKALDLSDVATLSLHCSPQLHICNRDPQRQNAVLPVIIRNSGLLDKAAGTRLRCHSGICGSCNEAFT